MIKKFFQYIKEDIDELNVSDDKYESMKKDVKEMIESTIENIGGEFRMFVSSLIKNPEDYKIEGLINDSDIYEFYLKHRNDIDEILSDINFFKETPISINAYGLYEYVIRGTERAVIEIVKKL